MNGLRGKAAKISLLLIGASALYANFSGNRLISNQQLMGDRSDYLAVANGSLRLVMQPDCNLVLYNKTDSLWASGTAGKGSGCQADMQSDGNFVVYTNAHKAVWSSNSAGHPGAFVILQEDANLVVYEGSKAMWAAGTAGQGFDIITDPPPAAGESKVWRIERPEVRQRHTNYTSIGFSPGDSISVKAGGCVQTGGSGNTWKLYVNPAGNNAADLYSGTFWIPGVTGSEDVRVAGVIGKVWKVPGDLPPTVASQLFLHLGYQDDSYSDNGYYRHDDGTGNQCQGVGDAWLEIHITKGTTTVVQGPLWSPHLKPFDLVWDVNYGVDANGLPLNPIWAYQIGKPGQKPDFEATCGAAITGGESIDEGKLASICSSQAPDTDLVNNLVPFLCPGDPLRGHLNWSLATYTGVISWSEWSGNLLLEDDDFNLTLQTTNNGGLTSASNGLGLEFNAGESIDSFNNSWWVNIRNDVETLRNDLPGSGSDTVAHAQLDGKLAVVTGLIGLDCVHGCYTESHPVYALAVRASDQVVGGGRQETWSFFIRNSGNEGNCSKLWHDWAGLNGTYYIQLPWPDGAKSVEVMSSDVNASSFGPAVGNGMSVEQDNGWTFLAFRLAAPASSSGYDGQITLHYITGTTPNETTTRSQLYPASATALPRAHLEDGIGWEALDQNLSGDVKQRFEQLNRSTPSPWHVASPSHTVKVQVNPTVAQHHATQSPANRGELTRAQTRSDARQAAIMAGEHKILSGSPLDVNVLNKLEPKAALH